MNGVLPKYRLVHVNRTTGERHYFQRLGGHWPARPGCRLIERVTDDPGKAVVFDTLPEALAVLVEAGDPPGWSEEVITPPSPTDA